jgi:hypothetical protein
MPVAAGGMDMSKPVLCRCGHDRMAHRHYRRGSDCALCDCGRWSAGTLLGRLMYLIARDS